jgi:diaminopimelate epimerase
MNARPFRKMHGLGNDFVVVDARSEPFDLDAARAARIADRRWGVGCDQVIVLEPARDGGDLALRFFNSDGSEAEVCGNGTRCVASLVLAEQGKAGQGKAALAIETLGGLLEARAAEGGAVEVDMGPPRFAWDAVPLVREMDTLHLDFRHGPLADPVALSMGNPHVVFFVEDAATVDLPALGPAIEQDPLFPQRTNVQLVQVLARDRIRHRIWERGAGLTQASGSGGCAAALAAMRRGLTDRRVVVGQPGGELTITWREADGHVIMTGPVATSFVGSLDPALL